MKKDMTTATALGGKPVATVKPKPVLKPKPVKPKK